MDLATRQQLRFPRILLLHHIVQGITPVYILKTNLTNRALCLILRPSAITRRLGEQESGDMLEPTAVSSAPSQEVLSSGTNAKALRGFSCSNSFANATTLPRCALPNGYSVPLLEVESSAIDSRTNATRANYCAIACTGKTTRQTPTAQPHRTNFTACFMSLLSVGNKHIGISISRWDTGMSVHPAVKGVHPRSQQAQSTPPTLQLSAKQIDFGANVREQSY